MGDELNDEVQVENPEEVKQEEVVEETEEQVDEKDKLIQELREQLAAISSMQGQPQQQQQVQQVPQVTQVQQPQQQVSLFSEGTMPEFVNDEDFKNLFEDGGKQTLNKVLGKATAAGMNSAISAVLAKVPNIVADVLAKTKQAERAFDALFERSPDLKPHQQLVANEAARLSQLNPALGIPELVSQAEAVTRQRLCLPKMAGKVQAKGSPTATPKTGSRGSSAVGAVGYAKQIQNQIAALKKV